MQPSTPSDLLAEVRRDIGALQAKIDQLRSVEAYLADKIGDINRSAANGAARYEQMNSERDQRRFSKMGQRQAAIAVMKEVGQPMRSGDVARAMMSGGYPYKLGVGKLSNSLFTSFTRGPGVFQKVGPGTWALTELLPEEQREIRK